MKYIEQFLAKRGLTDELYNEIMSYTPSYIKGTDEFCKVLHDSPRSIRIGLITDYDTDGFMAGIVNFLGLHLLGFTSVVISDRHVEKGYEFDIADVAGLGKVDMVITSDVGISCVEAVNYAKSLGIKTIVTDHHVPTDGCSMNNADIIIDYMLDGEFQSDNPAVCGAYTAYQVFERYFELYGSEFQDISSIKSDLLLIRHFAAVATVSDAMPLIGVNHCIVKDMIHFFNYINPADLDDDIVNGVSHDGYIQNVYNNLHRFVKLGADQYYNGFDMKFLEYTMIPIMNSIKRMCADTKLVYTMFFGDKDNSEEAANAMIELNTTRKVLVNDLFDRIFLQRAEQLFEDMIYMVNAPAGVLGLIAQKIITETGLPTVVLSSEPRLDTRLGEFVYDGSVRSPEWYMFLSRVNSSGIAKCSGHEPACAITVPVSRLMEFHHFLHDEISRYGNIVEKPVSKSDILASFDVVLDFDENAVDFVPDVNQFMIDLKQYGPFGKGFPAPNILLKFNKVHGAFSHLKAYTETDEAGQEVEKYKHVKITVAPHFDVLLWNTEDAQVMNSMDESIVCLTGYLTESYYNNERYINFVASPVLNGMEVA